MAVQSDRKVKIDKNLQFSKVYYNPWNLRIILRIVFYSFYIPKILKATHIAFVEPTEGLD